MGSVLLTSCASTKVEYQDTLEEMSIAVIEGKETKHYAPAEIANWSVLVLDTNNTNRTIEMCDKRAEDMLKYKNTGSAEDYSTEAMKLYQDVRLKKAFKNVSFTQNAEEEYDLIILRDIAVDVAEFSGKKTTCIVRYCFVTPNKGQVDGAEDKEWILLGSYSGTGYGTVPYPATSNGLQEANRSAVEMLNLLLEGGLDLYDIERL